MSDDVYLIHSSEKEGKCYIYTNVSIFSIDLLPIVPICQQNLICKVNSLSVALNVLQHLDVKQEYCCLTKKITVCFYGVDFYHNKNCLLYNFYYNEFVDHFLYIFTLFLLNVVYAGRMSIRPTLACPFVHHEMHHYMLQINGWI